MAGIVLYLIALGIAVLNQVPATAKLVELTREPALATAPPPAEVLALLRRTKTGGIALSILLLTIIFLMVIKPGGVA